MNEVLFAATSQDVLFSLSAVEMSAGKGAEDRLGRLAGHLLQQQSFCPQFPGPAGSQVCARRIDVFSNFSS